MNNNNDFEYLNLLMKSFMDATGTHDVEVNSSLFLKQFKNWLIKRQLIVKDYLYLLNKMNLDIDNRNCFEVGKGFLDSIIPKEFRTLRITPYSNYTTRSMSFLIIDGIPYYSICYKENKIAYVKCSEKDKIFMTQNPYTKDELNDWHEIHNIGNYDIIVGVYGNIDDKDKEEKIEQIISVKNKLIDDEYIEDRLITAENYCYTLASKRKNLKIE